MVKLLTLFKERKRYERSNEDAAAYAAIHRNLLAALLYIHQLVGATMAETALTWTEVESSNVKSVAYHEETETLCVMFKNGTLYTYSDVENERYLNLLHAQSVGQYLNLAIKGNYLYTKYTDLHDLQQSF